MAYKTKAECEEEFVDMIIDKGGLKSWGETYDNGHWYQFFDLKNGERRYWTNMSDKSKEDLGIGE